MTPQRARHRASVSYKRGTVGLPTVRRTATPADRTMSLRTALAATLMAAAAHAHAQGIDSLAWLAGRWIETNERGETEEAWTLPRGGMMAAANTSLRGGRSSHEFLRIVQRDGRLVYLASPGGRTPPTEFTLKEQAPASVVFENLAHDFPHRIAYRLDGDVLTARIEGTLGGQPRSMQWQLRRVR